MKKKVLCIDDSNTALMLMEYALTEAGFQALLALSVEEAIQKISVEIPDLILLDLSMPGVSGYDFLEMRAKLNLEKVPIIVISAFDSQESVLKTKHLGAIDFVSKPIKIDAVINKISAHFT